MAFIIENGTAGVLEIEDLGITLGVGQIADLSTRTQPQDIALSMESGEELNTLITSGAVIVKDPLDGVTDLSVADAITCFQSINDPHFRVGAGALIGDISDVNFTSLVTDEVLKYNGSEWVNAPLTSGFFQLEWRFSTSVVAADPSSGRFRYDNSTLAAVTEIYFDDFSLSGFDVGGIFSQISTGSKIYIQSESLSTSAALFTVTGNPIDNTGWWTIPVSVDSNGSLHANNAVCAVIFIGGGGGGGGADELVKVSSNDTVAGFLNTKIVAGAGITLTEDNDGGNETLTIDAPGVCPGNLPFFNQDTTQDDIALIGSEIPFFNQDTTYDPISVVCA